MVDKKIRPYDLFAKQVVLNAHRPAVTHVNVTLTYAELNRNIDQFAAYLRSYCIPPGAKIAIVLPSSISFITVALACQKLNYPYIPLDSTYPDAYLKKILEDAGVRHIVTGTTNLARLDYIWPEIYINYDNMPPLAGSAEVHTPDASLNETAYIIYTSGSTGDSKGVVIRNVSLVNLIQNTKEIYNISPHDRMPLFHSIGFDVSVWEIYSTLLNGAHLIIPPDNDVKASPKDYLKFLIDYGVTIANMTPSYFYLFSNTIVSDFHSCLADSIKLRLILLAGEAFHAKKITSWFDRGLDNKIALYNMYGITECTVHSTFLKITASMAKTEESFIGVPLPGVVAAIADEDKQPILNGDIGELCLTGDSISSGYLGHSSQSETKFINLNLDNTISKRWFLTGDLVKRADSGLEYISRKDKIVKIRGYRVNLGQIETTLCAYPNIEGAVVTSFLLTEEALRLVAFVKIRAEHFNEAEIISKLKYDLPSFMCPSKFILVDKFPLTKNAKIDINYLLQNYLNTPSLNLDAVANIKADSTLEKVKQAWQKILNLKELNVESNFFDAGGDSLLLAELHYCLQSTLSNKDFKIIDLLKYPSVVSFAQFLDSK